MAKNLPQNGNDKPLNSIPYYPIDEIFVLSITHNITYLTRTWGIQWGSMFGCCLSLYLHTYIDYLGVGLAFIDEIVAFNALCLKW